MSLNVLLVPCMGASVQEIIEFSAVILDTETLQILGDPFQRFVIVASCAIAHMSLHCAFGNTLISLYLLVPFHPSCCSVNSPVRMQQWGKLPFHVHAALFPVPSVTVDLTVQIRAADGASCANTLLYTAHWDTAEPVSAPATPL